jgi:hypothetical protein
MANILSCTSSAVNHPKDMRASIQQRVRDIQGHVTQSVTSFLQDTTKTKNERMSGIELIFALNLNTLHPPHPLPGAGVHSFISFHLRLVSRSTYITTTPSPVNVNVRAFLILSIRELRLDLEGVSAEVITLSLEEVGREILGAVTVEP